LSQAPPTHLTLVRDLENLPQMQVLSRNHLSRGEEYLAVGCSLDLPFVLPAPLYVIFPPQSRRNSSFFSQWRFVPLILQQCSTPLSSLQEPPLNPATNDDRRLSERFCPTLPPNNIWPSPVSPIDEPCSPFLDIPLQESHTPLESPWLEVQTTSFLLLPGMAHPGAISAKLSSAEISVSLVLPRTDLLAHLTPRFFSCS